MTDLVTGRVTDLVSGLVTKHATDQTTAVNHP